MELRALPSACLLSTGMPVTNLVYKALLNQVGRMCLLSWTICVAHCFLLFAYLHAVAYLSLDNGAAPLFSCSLRKAPHTAPPKALCLVARQCRWLTELGKACRRI